MGSISSQFRDLVLDLTVPLGPVQHNPFFGGYELRLDGVQFAMMVDDMLHLRVTDDGLRQDLIAAGSEAFTYSTKRGRVAVPKYMSVPADLLEDQDRLLDFCRRALAAL